MKTNTQGLLIYTISLVLSILISFTLIPSVKADTLSVSDDTFVDLLDIDNNFGTNPSLLVTDIIDRRTGEKWVFLRFDTSIIPYDEKRILHMASLKLWIDKINSPGDIDIYMVAQPWEENTLTGKTCRNFRGEICNDPYLYNR